MPIECWRAAPLYGRDGNSNRHGNLDEEHLSHKRVTPDDLRPDRSISHPGEAMDAANANLGILFITGFGPIVRDTAQSRRLYGDVMRIPFKEEAGGYLHTEALSGAKTFALWPLSQVAQSCFGENLWPDNVPVPQAWLEFDVDSVEKATTELESKGYKMLVKNKKEPWGQVVSRFLSPEGLLVGITFTPVMRES
jgi:hypothetical protein